MPRAHVLLSANGLWWARPVRHGAYLRRADGQAVAKDRQEQESVVLRGLARSPLALTLVKESAAVSTIFLVERVRRRSRMGAILTMVGLNSAYAIVVATNYHR
jgi:hypothetical protein